MLDFGFYNMDCMEGIKEFPDKYFDLAIVDPPYGINVTKQGMGAGGGSHLTQTVHADEHRRRKTFWLRGAKQELGGGGASVCHPKSITRSMMKRYQMRNTSRNLSECRKTGSSGGGQLFP